MLSRNFKPENEYDLIRLGKSNDGGYLIERESVKNVNSLISMGISTDWSFEKDFFDINKVPINAYDHTVNNSFWFRYIRRSIINFFTFRCGFKKLSSNIFLYMDYKSFFQHDRLHYKRKIGLKSKNETTLTDCLKEDNMNAPFFLKIDIEGGEYRILEQLISSSKEINGLAIEFHDVDIHKHRIEEFIRLFELTLVHIHPNNYGGIDNNGDPLVIEMTFCRNPTIISKDSTLPHKLDEANNPSISDIKLSISK